MPKTVALIPARYASSRFPGKLLVPLLNKPLLQHTYEAALRCSAIQDIFIAVDHPEVQEAVNSWGAQAILTPAECSCGSERIAYAASQLQEALEADYIVNVQGDEPCFSPKLIDQLIEALENNSDAVMATPITPLSHEDATNSSVVKCVKDQKGRALYFSRALIPAGHQGRWKEQIAYYSHIGIYAFRASFLPIYAALPSTPLQQAEDLEQLKALEHGYTIQTVITSEPSLGVNTPEDIERVENYLCKQNTSSLLAASSPR